MKLYNSYTQKTEPLEPIEERKISLYVCGPTVYNDPHIGNARPIVVFDTLAKALKAQGYDVTYASNYTDVDDKIIKKAIEEQKTEREITDRYIEAFRNVRSALGADDPDYTPRVTETMDKIIAFISDLIDNGAAYQVSGDVYYRVNSDPTYGELSHQRIDDLMVGARIDENEKKENPLDFTLWKQTDQGIQWDSPWGKGRPGWHTECVVMIQDVFKKPLIDIHGGGMDLKFPHHENELAQSRSVRHTQLANNWVHNGMINIDGIKMSKSLGNVLLAKDLIEEYGGPVCRWAMISCHYRAPLNISDDTLKNAAKELEKIRKPMQQALLQLALNNASAKNAQHNEQHWNAFMDAMNDDLNTPNAISSLLAAIKELNQSLRTRDLNLEQIASLYKTVEDELQVLGIELNLIVPNEQQLDLYRTWKQAAKEKNFELADQCRASLMEQGLI